MELHAGASSLPGSCPSMCFQACLLHDTACFDAQKGIMKLRKLLEGEEEEQFTAEQYMMLYTLVTPPLVLRSCFACCEPERMLRLAWTASSQHDLQHVHAKASQRLLGAAVPKISRLLQPVH